MPAVLSRRRYVRLPLFSAKSHSFWNDRENTKQYPVCYRALIERYRVAVSGTRTGNSLFQSKPVKLARISTAPKLLAQNCEVIREIRTDRISDYQTYQAIRWGNIFSTSRSSLLTLLLIIAEKRGTEESNQRGHSICLTDKAYTSRRQLWTLTPMNSFVNEPFRCSLEVKTFCKKRKKKWYSYDWPFPLHS